MIRDKVYIFLFYLLLSQGIIMVTSPSHLSSSLSLRALLRLLYHIGSIMPIVNIMSPKRGKKGATNYKTLSPSSSSKTLCTHTARPNKSGCFAARTKTGKRPRRSRQWLPGNGQERPGIPGRSSAARSSARPGSGKRFRSARLSWKNAVSL